MSSIVIWMLGIGASVAMLVIAAAVQNFYVHLAIAALVSILVALAAFSESREGLTDGKANMGLQASTNLRHMGLVWTWGALTTFLTYGFNILQWREWWHFFIGLLVLAGLSLFLSATLRKDAEEKSTDLTMFKIARGYAAVVFAAMIVTMVGLVQQGKMGRFFTDAGQRLGTQDWAANNIYFFGALALAALAWNALMVLRLEKR